MATKDNHYIPQWHQKGFMSDRENELCHLTNKVVPLPNGETKTISSVKWYSPAQRFYEEHLYTVFFGREINDEIEQQLFGPIDNNGSKAVRAFLTDNQSQWHHNFQDFITYLDAQKLRTPSGLDWIRSKYPDLDQLQLMTELQSLRTMHCTLWAEGVRELVSAEDSNTKFILSDHPITIYNFACQPNSELCNYPNEPDISLKGSQTIFPLDKNRCLILTNLEYAQDPENVNPLEQRTNATRIRQSMANTIEFINIRKLTDDDVTKINYIIKNRAKTSVAAGKMDWLYPERNVNCDWSELRHVLLPPKKELFRYGGEMYAKFEDGTVHYQDAFGRTSQPNEHLLKNVDEALLGRNDNCGCGSGKKYKICCMDLPFEQRPTWSVSSIRERNLMFCNCIRDILGLDRGKTWVDVRRELSDKQIQRIYEFYSILWPRETGIYALLPKSDGKFRGLYTGQLDIRTIDACALPLASMFDEFLIESPITNPNIIRPEFSPTKNPSKFKYQALKELLFILEMEPYIALGLINLIPSPTEFDMPLMREMMAMTRDRGDRQNILNDHDLRKHFALSTEDLLNSTAIMPREMSIRLLISEFNFNETEATQTIDALDRKAEDSPLSMLQPVDTSGGGQFVKFRMGPNYEIALLTAQATGAVLVTDSSTRWYELMSAQHREQGFVNYPWLGAYSQLSALPVDTFFIDEFKKSQGDFASYRQWLKTIDQMVLKQNYSTELISELGQQASDFMDRLVKDSEQVLSLPLQVSSPDGGFYDNGVQRLLARSSCLTYENSVRSVYGIGIQD
jgi:hypothetical protein